MYVQTSRGATCPREPPRALVLFALGITRVLTAGKAQRPYNGGSFTRVLLTGGTSNSTRELQKHGAQSFYRFAQARGTSGPPP